MARTDYGAILSTVIKDTSDAVREVNGTSSLIAPNQWGTAIRTMHSDSDYENALEQMIEETATGDIASFSDGANNIPCPSVLCSINPVQDLHGQDNPYPSGGGKNLIPSLNPMPTSGTVLREFSTPLSVSNVTLSFKFTGSFANGGAALIVGKDSDNNNAFLASMGWFKKASDNTTLSVNTTYTNELVYFTASVTAPISSIIYTGYSSFSSGATLVDAMIETGSTRTAYAPYENICPITGHTELNLVHTGKNYIDLSLANLENGTINGNTGALESATNRVRNKDYYVFPFDKIYNSSYIITIPSGYSLAMRFYDSTGTYIAMTGESTGWITELPSAVYGKDASYVKFVFRKTDNTDITPSTISSLQYQLELGSTATTYEPYTGTTTTTDFGTTVYGGTLDPVSGVLTIDRAIVDLSNITWFSYDSGSKRWQATITSIYNYPSRNGNLVAEKYVADITANAGDENKMFTVGGAVYIYYTDSTTPPSGNLVYPLATPTTTQLTPQEVKSLLGGNNFYHDCNGQVAVTYRANGELYVEQH